MKILRLSTLSLSLAIAVMTLGYATPLQAQDVCGSTAFCDRDGDGFFKDHNRCAVCGGETDCDDSDANELNVCADTGDSKTTFDVDMAITDPEQTCEGTTDKGLGAHFGDSGCPILLDDEEYGPGPFCLFVAEVRSTGQGIDVQLFFHRECGDPHCGGIGCWVSRRLPATIGPGPEGSSFQITMEETEVALTKNHQPDKGTDLDTKIAVGEMVYTAK